MPVSRDRIAAKAPEPAGVPAPEDVSANRPGSQPAGRSSARFKPVSRTDIRPQLPNEVWIVVDKAEQRLDRDLPWYQALSPADRDQLNLIIETAVADFIAWLAANGPSSTRKIGTPPSTDHIFFVAPLEFAKAISLRQALDVTRLIVDILERNVSKFARRGREEATRMAMLYYAREVAFSAANVYASAAEARTDWDARLEALAIEDLAAGDTGHHVAGRLTMLGWPAEYDCFAIVGTLAQSDGRGGDGGSRDGGQSGAQNEPQNEPGAIHATRLQRHIRTCVQGLGGECLIGLHEGLTVVLVNPRGHEPEDFCAAIDDDFSRTTPLCLGPLRHGIEGAGATVCAALGTMNVAPAVTDMHRPLRADDVLPERALFGDEDAREELYRSVYLSLRGASNGNGGSAGGGNGGNGSGGMAGNAGNAPEDNPLLATVSTFLLSGSSLEVTARELNVHPNTVRYRLKRSVEMTGWDPMTPREAYVLLTAIKIGRIMDARHARGSNRFFPED